MADGIFVAFASEKGGVAKTTTTLNLLTALSSGLGLRVLGLDCDPQGGLTFSFNVNRDNVPVSLYEVLLDEAMGERRVREKYGRRPYRMQDVIVETWMDGATKRFIDPTERVDPDDPHSPTKVKAMLDAGVDLIRGPDLAPISRGSVKADTELLAADSQNWPHSLKWALASVWRNYDYILADTNPSAGCLTGLCLATAPYFMVPMIPDGLGVQGMLNLLITAESSKRVLNPGLQLVGIVFTKVQGYKAHANMMSKIREQFAAQLKNYYPEWEFPIFDTVIQQLKDGADSLDAFAAAVAYRPNTQHAASYWSLLAELIDKVGGKASALLPDALQSLADANEQRMHQPQFRDPTAISES